MNLHLWTCVHVAEGEKSHLIILFVRSLTVPRHPLCLQGRVFSVLFHCIFFPLPSQKLILSETSIFDVLPNFFYHSNQVVRMAALEVRAWLTCLLLLMQREGGVGGWMDVSCRV